MTARPQISIVVANFNGAAFLAETIASAQAQTLPSWEMILVDDASTDDSVAQARAAAAGDPRVRVLRQPANRGPAAARNRALDEARGEWIAVCDSDDVMAPDRLASLLDRARREGTRIVADNQLVCGPDLAPQKPFLSARDVRAVDRADLALFIECSRLYSPYPDLGYLKPVFHRSLLAQTGARYDETLRVGEDFHFMASLLAAGERVSIEPRTLYFYRKHSASISHRLSTETIGRMIAADEAFAADAALSERAERALRRRVEGLKTWAVYERAIRAIKEGRWLQALRLAAGRPQALPLLLRPALQRLRRLLAPAAANSPAAARQRPLAKA